MAIDRRPVLLLGAGGAAREVAEVARMLGRDLLGFLDDDPGLLGRRLGGLPVLGPLDAVEHYRHAGLVACMGNPRAPSARAHVVARLALPDERYTTLISPTASIPASCSVGAGSMVLAGAVATADVTVGRHVLVMPSCVLTHDVVVDDAASLGAGVLLAGGVRVGATAYLGAGTRVREKVEVGAGALIGIGSLLLRNVGPAELWFGVPATLRGSAPD